MWSQCCYTHTHTYFTYENWRHKEVTLIPSRSQTKPGHETAQSGPKSHVLNDFIGCFSISRVAMIIIIEKLIQNKKLILLDTLNLTTSYLWFALEPQYSLALGPQHWAFWQEHTLAHSWCGIHTSLPSLELVQGLCWIDSPWDGVGVSLLSLSTAVNPVNPVT